MSNNKAFAEIIESSLDTFTAQSWAWDVFPRFGSLVCVRTAERIVVGCVVHVQTGSMDPLRYPFPYQKSEEELKKEQPQIFEFLKTTFQVKVLGYVESEKKIHYVIPPYPSKIHAFVEPCSALLAVDFLSTPDYLHILFSSAAVLSHFDDLLLALMMVLAEHKKLTNKILEEFIQTFSLLTGNDYRRIKLLLIRIQSIL